MYCPLVDRGGGCVRGVPGVCVCSGVCVSRRCILGCVQGCACVSRGVCVSRGCTHPHGPKGIHPQTQMQTPPQTQGQTASCGQKTLEKTSPYPKLRLRAVKTYLGKTLVWDYSLIVEYRNTVNCIASSDYLARHFHYLYSN